MDSNPIIPTRKNVIKCFIRLKILIKLLFNYSFLILKLKYSIGESTAIQDTFRVGVQSGGNVQFKINSIQHYNTEITYSDWTTLRIHCDTLSIGYDNIWELEVKAMETEDSLQSNYPNRALGLDNIKLKARNLTGGPGSASPTDEKTLSNNYQTLIEFGDAGTYEVDIRYKLAPTLGKPPAYYITNLDFHMISTP